ncbi:MoxR family ATPase [Aquihabitans sp. G128]|uniref:AAA family ATPase n=1 Tax=Aquihabitans sp. G128 TaxID=2849779 RepID=UPI0020B18BE8|nr:MoxR family ATPase [Aquihabitans sp. G128]
MTEQPTRSDAIAGAADRLEQTLFEVKKVIVGQDRVVERLLICLLAKGHALLEGVPGLAKTLAAETIAVVVGGSFTRIQFTPDLLPADVMGTRIYRASTETFDVELGPVFANFVLADEINRAPAKVQSALLEVMAEHQVSIGGTSYPVPEPFLVLATQNPIEQEGVYPLPEAQRDRFLMKIVVDYPTPTEEVEIVQRMGVAPPQPREALSIGALAELQQAADQVFVAREVVDYAVSLVLATREPDRYGLGELRELISYGASPRASLGLVAAGRAMALLRGRSYVLPQDVFDVAPDVLRHRLVLSYEALARDLSVDDVLGRLLSTVPAPRVAPSQDPTSGPAPLAAVRPAAPAPLPTPPVSAAGAPTPSGAAWGPPSGGAPAGPSWGSNPEPSGPIGWGTDGIPSGSTGTEDPQAGSGR